MEEFSLAWTEYNTEIIPSKNWGKLTVCLKVSNHLKYPFKSKTRRYFLKEHSVMYFSEKETEWEKWARCKKQYLLSRLVNVLVNFYKC